MQLIYTEFVHAKKLTFSVHALNVYHCFQIKYYLNWVDTGAESPDSPSPEGTMCHPLCQCAKCQLLQKVK